MSRFMILPIATILIVSSSAFGQTATGILQGRVADDSGAAVPEAKVTIENERTAVRQVTMSNSLGNYMQPYLQPSTYKVTVEKTGFQKYSTSGVTVEVQKSTELGIILKVGEVNTTVEVSASGAQLATTTSTVSPGRIHSGGVRFRPTPPGVPVTMTSPGASGQMVEM